MASSLLRLPIVRRSVVAQLGFRSTAAGPRGLLLPRTASQAPRSLLQTVQRRQYASAGPEPGTPKQKKSKLRYLWRATYLSGLGGIAYLGYAIFDARHPHQQTEADPSKKTLVILGEI